ncbi:ankyrin repeat-containing domain protein [Daldinia eschscholtzii]|nr:ankyrin repeat-containing domain protein [Daldinia eschscholtzii]
MTELHLAALRGSSEVVKLLLDEGAKVDIFVSEYGTPLSLASQEGHIEVMKLLIARGADVNAYCPTRRFVLFGPAWREKSEAIKILHDHGADFEAKTETFGTALYAVIGNGNLEVVRNPNHKLKNGVPLLHVAIYKKNLEMVLGLLECGVQATTKNSSGMTALQLAIKVGSLEILELLYHRGAALDDDDQRPYHALHLAIVNERHDIIEWLLKKGEDEHHIQTRRTMTLNIAAREGFPSVIRNLLTYFGLDADGKCREVNGVCEGGKTPLHTAAENGHLDIVKILVEAGADPNIQDDTSKTPLHFAEGHGNKEIMEFLIENGAQQSSSSS